MTEFKKFETIKAMGLKGIDVPAVNIDLIFEGTFNMYLESYSVHTFDDVIKKPKLAKPGSIYIHMSNFDNGYLLTFENLAEAENALYVFENFL